LVAITGNTIKKNTILAIVFILINFCSAIKIAGQNEEAISPILNSSDQKKLEKANNYKNQADGLIEEANQLYMETFSVQANYELGEKKIKQKVTQLESKAQQKQFEAHKLYQKCNEIKFELFKEYIEKFWSEFNGDENTLINAKLIEEQSNDYYFQANSLYRDAAKIKDNKEKIKKLNQAHDLEIRALEKQISALGIYYSLDTSVPQLAETPVQQQDHQPIQDTEYPVSTQSGQSTTSNYNHSASTQTLNQTSGKTKINQEFIDKYIRYLEDTTSSLSGFLTPQLLQKINSFNADQILNFWYNYIFNEAASPDLIEKYLAEQIPSDTGQALPSENEKQITGEYQGSSSDQVTQVENIPTASGEEKIIEIHEGEEEKAKLIPTDEDVIYRVQIAANKSQLTQQTLVKMYYGNKQVDMINENGWYKYSIGDFEDFQSADKFRKGCGVPNAFIVAYRKGTHFMAPPEERVAVKTTDTYIFSTADSLGLLFRIQVAANRVTLTKSQLARIYNGNSIEQIEEDGWYKYQLPGVRLFSDAIKIVKDIQVPGVFIAAYEDGKKIDLYEAVKKVKALEKEVEIYGRKGRVKDVEFYVQIAASQLILRPNELAELYNGSENIILVIEDNWYKYRIRAGFSYDKALQIKNNCGVDKAFIVAYDRARKVSLYWALNRIRKFN